MDLDTYYVNDSEEEIIQKKFSKDIDIWISHLQYISDESDQLAKISSKIIEDRIYRDALLEQIEKAMQLLNELYQYKNAMVNYNECDDLECDLFYLNTHDEIYDKYLEYVKHYRALKEQIYLQVIFNF